MSDNKSFVHLHTHSQYSLLEATCEFDSLCARANDFKMPALALTDYGNMFGAIEFYFAAKSANLKPIIGLEVYIAPKGRLVKGEDQDSARMPNRRLVLLAMNYEGYQNLCKISSVGYQEGFYYRPRIDYEILEKYNENLIALSGSLMGDVPWTFKNQGEEKANERLDYYKKIFGDRFYVELNRTGVNDWTEINQYLVKAAKLRNIKIVATNDVHYTLPQDQVGQEVLICIGSNKTLQDPSRFRLGSDQFYFKSAEQMRELFKDLPEACDNTLEIAERCNVKFTLKTPEGKPIYHLPSYPTQLGKSLKEEIALLAKAGLKRRFEELKNRGEPVPADKVPTYLERLEYELKVIHQMDFNGYFLIVQDFIGWAKKNNIPVGPGRGSGAGSLVAYSLGITDLDPMQYNLIFERFLNPERISMPDFDVDFCQENRGRVIDYVTQKYGEASVSQIITYGKLQTKAAIRDVGRVLGMTFGEVDVVSKLIPDKLGITLKEAIDLEPRLRDMMEDDPKIGTLMELAQKIEGLTRHAGIHAAGVIIADGRIVDKAPLYRGADGENVVQYDMKHSEKLGLIKFDFLGLKTLTHISEAMRLVEKNRNKKIAISDISLKDPGVYEVMCKGDTAGIFQFESEGITDLIRKAQPNCFEDIVAINALYRPGPMDMIPDYLDRKSGRKKVDYLFKELEPILKETYGIIVYQEQVQLIAAHIANYTLGEADILRRAMGKKDVAEMAHQKTRFLEGAKANGHDMKKAEELFDLMAKFAEYGFNKSHAAAYCVVAAYTAYLKNYYPVEFYAALLSTEKSDTDKIVKYVKDARRHNIHVRPPDISFSEYKFNVVGDEIVFSLGAIKGVGEAAVEAILEARQKVEGGKFESLEQFFELVDLRRVNKKTIESLIKAGALDGYGYNRAELARGYIKFIERSDKRRKDNEMGQESLFAFDSANQSDENLNHDTVQLEPLQEWSRQAKLTYEKEVLGFYLSGHPLDSIDSLLKIFVTGHISGLNNFPTKSKIAVAGMVSTLKEIITKKGTRMAFANFEDTTASLELVIFPDVYAQNELLLKGDGALIISGTLEKGEEAASAEGAANPNAKATLKVLVDKVQRAQDLLKQAKRLTIRLNSDTYSETDINSKLALLKEVMKSHPGATTFVLQVQIPEFERVVDLEVSDPRGVDPSPQFFESVTNIIEEPKWTLT
jgi:DNA polymerase III subunit alpha